MEKIRKWLTEGNPAVVSAVVSLVVPLVATALGVPQAVVESCVPLGRVLFGLF